MTRKDRLIHLGYAVGTGEAVGIPLRHMVVTGQTQESGKTTTLEALVSRSGLRAIAFVTKRGEGSFAEGRRIHPYFRDRADWQFVDQLLSAQLGEKNKYLRQWIIKTCRHTKTLADVQREVRKQLQTAKGVNEGAYTQLDAYLELIVPDIRRARLAERIDLAPGLNVMDVSAYSTPMQMLFVQSAIEWVNEHEDGVVTIIPEAWEFIPEGKGSPVKAAAVALVRKGAGLQNYIWVDSQDTAGVDKVILRGCPVWIIGVQREANEIKRNLSNIPPPTKPPKPGDVALLQRGQFFVCFGDRTVKTYVQPAWMDNDTAFDVARLGTPPPQQPAREAELLHAIARDALRTPDPEPRRLPELAPHTSPVKETAVDRAEADRLQRENEDLKRRLQELEQRLSTPTAPASPGPRREDRREVAPPALWAAGEEAMYQAIKGRLVDELPTDARVMAIVVARPELRVEIERQIVTVDGNSGDGWIGKLIVDRWFDDVKTGYATFQELLRRGARLAKPTAYKWCDGMVKRGFLTKEGTEGYRVVPGMKVNVVER